VRIPGADLKPNTTYAFIATGVLGQIRPGDRPEAINSCDVTLRQSGATYQVQHRQDMAYTGHRDPARTGHPFQVMLITTLGSADPQPDFELSIRLDAASSRPPFAHIDGPAVWVWDLTASSGLYRHWTVATWSRTTPLTLGTSPTLAFSDAPLTANKLWGIWWAAELEHAGDWLPGVWLTKTASAINHLNVARRGLGFGEVVSYIGSYGRGRASTAFQRQRLGDFTIVAPTALDPVTALSLYLQDFYGTATSPHSKVSRVDMLAINLTDTISQLSRVAIDDDVADNLYGPLGEADSIVVPHSIAAPMIGRWVTQHRVQQWVSQGTRQLVRTASAVQELDGRMLNPLPSNAGGNPLALLTVDLPECLPMARHIRADVLGGIHCQRLWGWRDTTDPQDQNAIRSTDHLFGAWVNRTDYTWPAPVLDVVGPTVEIVPGREALGIGTLTLLPYEPSAVLESEELDEAVEHNTPTGYRTTWPPLVSARRRYPLRWAALTAAQKTTLVAFLVGLQTTKGAFRWQPPDSATEHAFVLDMGQGHGWTQRMITPNAFQLEAAALQLVYVGP